MLSYEWTTQGVYFVTRLKENAAFRVIQERPVPQNSNILADQVICFTGTKVRKHCPSQMRRIVAWDDKNQQKVVFLTNHLGFGQH